MCRAGSRRWTNALAAQLQLEPSPCRRRSGASRSSCGEHFVPPRLLRGAHSIPSSWRHLSCVRRCRCARMAVIARVNGVVRFATECRALVLKHRRLRAVRTLGSFLLTIIARAKLLRMRSARDVIGGWLLKKTGSRRQLERQRVGHRVLLHAAGACYVITTRHRAASSPCSGVSEGAVIAVPCLLSCRLPTPCCTSFAPLPRRRARCWRSAA